MAGGAAWWFIHILHSSTPNTILHTTESTSFRVFKATCYSCFVTVTCYLSLHDNIDLTFLCYLELDLRYLSS